MEAHYHYQVKKRTSLEIVTGILKDSHYFEIIFSDTKTLFLQKLFFFLIVSHLSFE